MARFLRNNGKPSIIKIANQAVVQYMDEKGKSFKLEIIMKREGNDDPRVKQWALSDYEKSIVSFEKRQNDKDFIYTSRVTKPRDFSFTVKSYPHMFNIHIGTGQYDERIYYLARENS